MTDTAAHQDEAKKLFASERAELVSKQNSNSENYDKAILTLSSGGLGLSLAVLKDVVPHTTPVCLTILVQSWFFFVAAIVVTVASFQTSQRGIATALDHSAKYYLEGRPEYLNKSNVWVTITNKLNLVSGVFFVLAVLWTAYFVATNLTRFHG